MGTVNCSQQLRQVGVWCDKCLAMTTGSRVVATKEDGMIKPLIEFLH